MNTCTVLILHIRRELVRGAKNSPKDGTDDDDNDDDEKPIKHIRAPGKLLLVIPNFKSGEIPKENHPIIT